jgi:cytochrome c oxidase subunit IV
MKLRARQSQNLDCPYCRGPLARGEAHPCDLCGVSLHADCAEANGGCVTLGCVAATKPWPDCRHCRRPLQQRQSTVCLHCGFDHRSAQHIPRDPSLIWMTPWRRWTSRSTRHVDHQRVGQSFRWKIALALIVLGAGLSNALMNSGSESLEILNLIFIPTWGLTVLAFFLSRA